MSEQAPIITPWDDDPLMYVAFIGCVRWALGEDEIMARFRKDTGNLWRPASSGIDRLIDRATGIERDFMQAFSDWVADNIFGRPEDMAEVAPAIAGGQ